MPARMRPVTIVAIAPQRNQNSAVGAITLEIAGFCSSGIFGMEGVCTKLKYQSKPIHMTPLMMWSQRNANSHHSCVTNLVFPPLASGYGVEEEIGHAGDTLFFRVVFGPVGPLLIPPHCFNGRGEHPVLYTNICGTSVARGPHT